MTLHALDCPNCGAPATEGGQSNCAYCGSLFIRFGELVGRAVADPVREVAWMPVGAGLGSALGVRD